MVRIRHTRNTGKRKQSLCIYFIELFTGKYTDKFATDQIFLCRCFLCLSGLREAGENNPSVTMLKNNGDKKQSICKIFQANGKKKLSDYS
jgi:hypothetical protein